MWAFDLLPGGPLRLALLVRTLILNEIIAILVALSMASVNGQFGRDLLIANVYAQTIGLLCMFVSAATFHRFDLWPFRHRIAAVSALYFVTGVLGAELARRITAATMPDTDGNAAASLAVGAVVAVIVGIGLIVARQLHTHVVETEFEALQARINPHFLFNTLNSIAALIREDPARAEAMTLQLSALFRYTLQAPRQGLVPLRDELLIVEGYVGIEQERFGDRLRYRADVDPTLLDLRTPALILQPIVENAVKHGLSESAAGGTIELRGWRENGRVCISVTNSGAARESRPGTGEGLENVRRRLRATFGRDAEVVLSNRGGSTELRLTFREAAAPYAKSEQRS